RMALAPNPISAAFAVVHSEASRLDRASESANTFHTAEGAGTRYCGTCCQRIHASATETSTIKTVIGGAIILAHRIRPLPFPGPRKARGFAMQIAARRGQYCGAPAANQSDGRERFAPAGGSERWRVR